MEVIGIIILAAGSSSRMKGSKQLLQFEGESLLRKTILTALTLQLPTITVLGNNYKQHKREIADLETDVVFNIDWRKGMGNSLKHGLTHLHKTYSDLKGCLIMVCDQPLINEKVLFDLVESFEQGNEIVAAKYANVFGVPAIFSSAYFKPLLSIPDDKGAKGLIDKHGAFPVDFPAGKIDIDTDEDWEKLNKMK